jgi:hypothetical protein
MQGDSMSRFSRLMPLGLILALASNHASGQQATNADSSFDGAMSILETLSGRPGSEPETEARGMRVLYRLLGLPAQERYTILRDWTFSTGEQGLLRHYTAFIHEQVPPPEFQQASPAPIVTDPLISTLTMLVDAARDCGQLESLSSDILELNSDSEPSRLLQLMVDVERNADDIRPRLLQQVKATEDLRQAGGRNWSERLLSAVLFRSAVRHRETYDLAMRLHAALLTASKRSADFITIVWLYQVGAEAANEGLNSPALRPSADPGLKHWAAVDLSTAANNQKFGGVSWWLATGDRMGHVSSPYVDHLVLAYPLTGSFEIQCESFNGLWSEANVGFGGFMFEPWNQGSSTNATYSINQHDGVGGPKPQQYLDQFNPITIRVNPNRLQAFGIDSELLYDGPPASTTSPFLLLRTTWLSAFRNLRIIGQPVIPRSIPLIAGQDMGGWITSFYNETQPPILTGLSVNAQRAPRVEHWSDGESPYDWEAREGELRGRRRFEAIASGRSDFLHGESWAYHHRPLKDAERVKYEFFYQPGFDPIEVHPTLGRIAFLLEPEGVKLHWLTSNREHVEADAFAATDNAIEEPENRRGPTPISLKANDWNSVVVEIRDGRMWLDLNGTLIYSRPHPTEADSRFGLYRDAQRCSSRVREATLSGDWPEWSTEMGSKLLERRVPLFPGEAARLRAILGSRLTAVGLAGQPEE